MLYELFWKWLTLDKRRHCEHEFVKTKQSSELVYYDIYYYNHYKCSDCGKKKKSLDGDLSNLSSRNYIMF